MAGRLVTFKKVKRGRIHTYVDEHGTKIKSVTQLISEGFPKPALTSWAARCAAERAVDMSADQWSDLRSQGRDAAVKAIKGAYVDMRDAAAARGTTVHNIAEKVMRGEVVEVPEAVAGHVESALQFMKDWQLRPVLIERPVISRTWSYAGTFDLIADVPDGRRILFDYKTGASGIWPDTALQLAAYRFADHYLGTDDETEIPMKEVGITHVRAVWVRADGYDVIPLRADEQVFKAFLHVASVARFIPVMPAWKAESERPSFVELSND